MKNLFSFLLFFCGISAAFSQQITEMINPVQWESLSTLPAAATSFSEHEGRIWAANGNLYYSDDDGITWTRHLDFLFEDITQVVAGEFGVIAARRRFYDDFPPYSNTRRINFFRSDD